MYGNPHRDTKVKTFRLADFCAYKLSGRQILPHKKNPEHLNNLINHPGIMSDPSYDIFPKRRLCLLSYGDDKYKNKEKYNVKRTSKKIISIAEFV